MNSGNNFTPSQPIRNINLTSAFKAKKEEKEAKGQRKLNVSSLDSSFLKLGLRLEKSNLHHDYRSYATMGLKKLKKTGSVNFVARKVTTVNEVTMKLDLSQKANKLEANAQKIKEDLERDMFVNPKVVQFCEEIRTSDRLPELELACQQEENFRTQFLKEKQVPPKINYVLPKKKRR